MGNLIYVVDDEQVSREMVAEFLELKGHEPVMFSSGEALLSRMNEQTPDLILLDIKFQDGMNGFEVCKTLKSRGHTKDIPIIFTSGLSDPDDKVKAFDAGAVDYLTKPIQLKELSARITTHLTIQSLQADLKSLNANLEKQVAERSRELNRWASVFDATDIGMSIGNAESLIIEVVNPAFARMHGYEVDELIGSQEINLFAPADTNTLEDIKAKVTVNGHGTFEVRRIRKDGTIFPVLAEVTYIPGGSGLAQYQAVLQDITDMERAREALRESELRLRRLSEAAFEGICMVDGDTIVDANDQLLEMLNYKREAMIGLSLSDIFSDHGHGLSVRRLADGETDPLELLAETPSGRLVNVEVRTRSLSHKPRMLSVAVVRDVTERIEAEKKAEEQRQQLVRADKMASLGTLVAGVAHEINNPNQAVLSNASRLKRIWTDVEPVLNKYYDENGDFLLGGIEYSKAKARIQSLIGLVANGSNRIKKIVTDLKNFYKDAGKQYTVLNINDVVLTAIDMTNTFVSKSTTNFKCSLAEDLPTVEGDFQALEQVLVNLIANACQSLTDSAKGITVLTGTDPAKTTVMIEVADEGVGIPTKELGNIFDPFYTTKREIGGTGLGLSISGAIVKEHAGKLEFSSVVGKGTTATITLPAADK